MTLAVKCVFFSRESPLRVNLLRETRKTFHLLHIYKTVYFISVSFILR